jgi:hypothetical protein
LFQQENAVKNKRSWLSIDYVEIRCFTLVMWCSVIILFWNMCLYICIYIYFFNRTGWSKKTLVQHWPYFKPGVMVALLQEVQTTNTHLCTIR